METKESSHFLSYPPDRRTLGEATVLNPSSHEGHHDEAIEFQGFLVSNAGCSWIWPGQQSAVAPQLLAHQVASIP